MKWKIESLPDSSLKNPPSAVGTQLGSDGAHVDAGRVVSHALDGQRPVRMNGQAFGIGRNVFEIFLPRNVDVGSDLGDARQVGR